MSNTETLLIILFAINNAALIFLLFERDRLLKRIDRYEKWFARLDDKTRRLVDHVNIIGAKVFHRQQ